LLFLYRDVLSMPIDAPRDVVAARTPHRLPIVLTRDEVRSLLDAMIGVHQLMAKILYGALGDRLRSDVCADHHRSTRITQPCA
jgi:hypothetical protein